MYIYKSSKSSANNQQQLWKPSRLGYSCDREMEMRHIQTGFWVNNSFCTLSVSHE